MTGRLLRLGLTGWRRHPMGTALSFLLVVAGATAVMLALQLRVVALDPWEHTFEATNGAHLLAFGPTPEVARAADAPGVTEAAEPLPAIVTSLVTTTADGTGTRTGTDTGPGPAPTSGRSGCGPTVPTASPRWSGRWSPTAAG